MCVYVISYQTNVTGHKIEKKKKKKKKWKQKTLIDFINTG